MYKPDTGSRAPMRQHYYYYLSTTLQSQSVDTRNLATDNLTASNQLCAATDIDFKHSKHLPQQQHTHKRVRTHQRATSEASPRCTLARPSSRSSKLDSSLLHSSCSTCSSKRYTTSSRYTGTFRPVQLQQQCHCPSAITPPHHPPHC